MTAQTMVFAYLRRLPGDGEATTTSICHRTGLQAADVLAVLEAALKAGLVTERRRNDHPRAPRYWATSKAAQ